jgi:DNA-directed RNA polymerase subunit H (RpoH/RPB5)
MELDLTTITHEASVKVWEEVSGGNAAPFEEQDTMLQLSIKAKVLPVITTVIPVVEQAVKEKLGKIIDDGYELGWGPDEILMALTVELSEDT